MIEEKEITKRNFQQNRQAHDEKHTLQQSKPP